MTVSPAWATDGVEVDFTMTIAGAWATGTVTADGGVVTVAPVGVRPEAVAVSLIPVIEVGLGRGVGGGAGVDAPGLSVAAGR